MTWEKGRQLKQFGNYTYKYNNDGIRIEKTENCKVHKYILDGTNILKEIVEDSCCNCTGYTNEYLYDLDGTVCGLKYNGTAYYFYKNLQGDVIAITNETGAVVARYSYDAWGKCTVESDASGVDIANINPFRYRSYYYDFETGLYYLQSRYYDPEIGRFINADDAALLWMPSKRLCQNAFSYCYNNAVNAIDPLGYIALVDDAVVLAFIAITLLLLATIAWMSTPEFREAWMFFCNDVGNGLTGIWDAIAVGGQAAWNWTRAKVKTATAAIKSFLVIARADAKIRKLVRRNSRDRYWTATLRKNYVDIGRAISYNTAVKMVSQGRSVFTVTAKEAYAVAKVAYGKKTPMGPRNHGIGIIGYYWHYHVSDHIRNGHVYFLFF